jgi:fructuronate reductase
MAAYVDDLLARSPNWGIVGASLRRPDTRDALAPQDYLYTLAVRDASGAACRVIGSILDVMDANTQRAELIALMADPRIRIVSLTVTEKGYCHDPATGELDESIRTSSTISRTLTNRSARPAHRRGAAAAHAGGHAKPFTVMSCDNLPSNGKTCGRIVTRFAELASPELAAWVRANVASPRPWSIASCRRRPRTTGEAVRGATGPRMPGRS